VVIFKKDSITNSRVDSLGVVVKHNDSLTNHRFDSLGVVVKNLDSVLTSRIDSVIVNGGLLPDGTEDNEILLWDNTSKDWKISSDGMLKSTYDTDSDGMVDKIDTATISQVNLLVTNPSAAAQNWVLSYDLVSGGFVWQNPSTMKVDPNNISLPEGFILVGDNSAKAVAFDVNDDGKIIIGNGTTLNSVTITGDVTLNNSGDVQIVAGAVKTNCK